MKNKYGLEKSCRFCGSTFNTKPRFLEFCSQSCKNPINRAGNTPWNKGIKLTDEQKSKMNIEGLKQGHGWNRGQPNDMQRVRWTGASNPNWDGRINNSRPKNYVNDEFSKYKRECKQATYRTIYNMRKEGLVPLTGKQKTDLQLDHIIPYKQGFELGISSSIIGSRNNLRFILGEENRRKWDSYQSAEIVESIIKGTYGLQ
jgi:hypothetical protein